MNQTSPTPHGALKSAAGDAADDEALEALRRSEQQMRTLLDSTPVVLVAMDANGRITQCSGAGFIALGIDEAALNDIVGTSIFDAYVSSPELTAAARRALDGEVIGGVFEFADRFFQSSFKPVLDAAGAVGSVIATAIDVTPRVLAERELRATNDALDARVAARTEELTVANEHLRAEIVERQRVEEALRDSEGRFRLLAENASDLISRERPRGGLLYVSPSSRALLGYEPHELEGTPSFDLVHPDDVQRVRDALRALAETGTITVTCRIRRKNGSYVHLESTDKAVRDESTGRIIEVQSVSRDVTARQAAEAEVRRLAELKSDFVALVSHELRAPLTNMNGGLEIIAQDADALPERARRTLRIVTNETQRLNHLVASILDLSRLDAGQLPIVLGPVAIDVTLDQMIQARPPQARKIIMRVPGRLPLAWADEVCLGQVIRNLISNAEKYSPEAEPIIVEVANEAAQISISVIDRGPGVSVAERGQIFDAFVRGDSAKAHGHGLGLHVARRLIEAQGGTIDVCSPASSDGSDGSDGAAIGSRFTITVPAAPHEE